VEIDTISGTSLDFKIEARLQGNEGQAAQIWPGSGDHSETTTGSFIVQVPDIVYQVRIGVKITGDSGTQNVDVVYNSVQGR
jgi:cobalamin biosynthesis protein CbiD